MDHHERRRAVRVSKPFEVQYSQDCPFIDARAGDLSETGLFLETHHPLEIGSKVKLRFDLADGNDLPITAQGVVLWIDPLVGVGVAFVDLADDQRERIKFWVADQFFKQLSER